jgi:UDP-N-acetylglucosamine--N-acetylmuramyl-(pentapeptide) pyrophosphoryl-undecaprenol N-acetylglucosamine transferase
MTDDRALRIVIAGGGTGGHLFPGIAVARELLARRPGAEISFAGTARGLEARAVPREGFELDLIRSGGLKGKSVGSTVRGIGLLPLSVVDAWRIVSRRRPDLVIGVGGYSSGPVVLVAAMRGTPTMLLEQNAVPGLTNRILARFVRAAAVTFEETVRFFGSKAFVSGNPVRPEFIGRAAGGEERRASESSGDVEVLIFGGSQGAHAINLAMVAAAPQLAAGGPRVHLTHQTGERDVAVVRDAYHRAAVRADVEPFLFDMADRMRAAHVIVCRAGSTTLSEIAAIGRAAVLVPLPTATDDHQRRNAEALVAAGAAEMLLQADATGEALAARILGLAQDRERRTRMAAAVRALARPNAARRIVDRALSLAGQQPA